MYVNGHSSKFLGPGLGSRILKVTIQYCHQGSYLTPDYGFTLYTIVGATRYHPGGQLHDPRALRLGYWRGWLRSTKTSVERGAQQLKSGQGKRADGREQELAALSADATRRFVETIVTM